MEQQPALPGTEPVKFDAEAFFLSTVWPYWRALKWHHGIPGSRGACLKSWMRAAKTEEAARRIFAAIEAQSRYAADREKHRQPVDRWPHLTTWLNQARYEDEIGSHSALREARPQGKCEHDGCSEDSHGPFRLCAYHYSMSYGSLAQQLREKYKALGCARRPGEDRAVWLDRLRETSRKLARRFLERAAV